MKIPQLDEFIEVISSYINIDKIRTIYDIGAGSCEETIEFTKRLPNVNVYAFECNPACIYNCAKNIVNLDRITFIPVCVYGSTGIIKFHPINQEKTITNRDIHPDGNPRASSIYLANGKYLQETYVQDEIVIPCMTIKNMIKLFKLPKPEILWMDLQGAELQALKGIKDLSTVKVIHTEVTNMAIYEGQCMYPELKKYLEDRGFVLVTDPDIFQPGWIFGDVDFVHRRYLW